MDFKERKRLRTLLTSALSSLQAQKLEGAPRCPACNTLNDGCTPMEAGTHPKPGDVTVCTTCNTVLQFTENLSYKLAPPDVIEETTLQVSQAQRAATGHRNLMKAIKEAKH